MGQEAMIMESVNLRDLAKRSAPYKSSRTHLVTGFTALSLFVVALAGCASSQQKPPNCKGEYQPINALDKYPAIEDGSSAKAAAAASDQKKDKGT